MSVQGLFDSRVIIVMKRKALLRLNTLVLFALCFPLTVKGADSTEDNENFSLGEINVLGTSSNDEDKDALIESYRSPVPSTYLGKDEVERYRGRVTPISSMI